MGKKTLSPFGCKDCSHAWIERCGLTGYKLQWKINAKYHCQHFERDKHSVVGRSDTNTFERNDVDRTSGRTGTLSGDGK